MICMATPTTHPAMIIDIHTKCGSWRSTITPTLANAENAARKVPIALSSSGVSISTQLSSAVGLTIRDLKGPAPGYRSDKPTAPPGIIRRGNAWLVGRRGSFPTGNTNSPLAAPAVASPRRSGRGQTPALRFMGSPAQPAKD
jgi:hypothetical protein